MTMTKNAVGNLIARYKTVLQNCSLLNTFGSLALAGALVLGGASGVLAADKIYHNGAETTLSEGSSNHLYGGSDGDTDLNSAALTITGGDFIGFIVGGNSTNNADESATMGTVTTTILDGTFASSVYGGDAVNHGSAETTNANITISGGTFDTGLFGGSGVWNVGSTAEVTNANLTISGGNLNCVYGAGFVSQGANTVATSTVKISDGDFSQVYSAGYADYSGNLIVTTASLDIDGGIFSHGVYGGAYSLNDGSAVVTTASVDISGGTFEGDVYGGGRVDASGTDSSVKTATVTISGGTFKGDIYAGGLGYATVESSSVTISGGTINGIIYGTGNGDNASVKSSTLNLGVVGAGYSATIKAFQDFTNVNIVNGAKVSVNTASFGADSTFTVGTDAQLNVTGDIAVKSGANLVVGGDFTVVNAEVESGAWGLGGATVTAAPNTTDAASYDSSTLKSSSDIVVIKSVEYAEKTYSVRTGAASADVIKENLGANTSAETVALVASALNNQDINPAAAKFVLGAVQEDNAGVVIEGAQKLTATGAVIPGLGNVKAGVVKNIEVRVNNAPQATSTTTSETSTWLAMNGDGAILPAADGGKTQGFGIWFMPMFNQTSADGFKSGSNSYGYDSNIVGATLGADYTFASDLRLGLAFNVGDGSSSSTGDFASTDNEFTYYGVSLYGAQHFDDFGLSFDMGYTVSENDMSQEATGGDLYGTADAALFTIGAKAEYLIPLDCFNVTPYAGIRFNYYDVDAYDTKQGADALFSTASGDSTVWEIPVGVTFDTTTKVGSWDMTPSLGLGVKFAMGDLDAEQEVSIAGVADSYVLSSEVADDVTFQGALGLGFAKDNCSLGVSYTLDLSENVESHGVSATLRYDF